MVSALLLVSGAIIGAVATAFYLKINPKFHKQLNTPIETQRRPPHQSKPRIIVQTDEKAALIEQERMKAQGWDPVSGA